MCGTFIIGISWMFLIFFNVAKYKLSPLCTTHLYASICYQLVYYSIDSHVCFLWEKNVLSNAKHLSLFLPSDMAAVQNLYFPTTCVLGIQNQHYQNSNLILECTGICQPLASQLGWTWQNLFHSLWLPTKL